MNIILPQGYELPENVRPGESFEAVVTIQPAEDGSFAIVALDGMELGAEPAVEEEALNEEQKFAAKVPLPWDNPAFGAQ